MPARNHPATRTLGTPPDLAQLKRQARELLEAFRAGDAQAVAEVHACYRGARPATFALHDAQLVIARSYGYASWPRLKAYVDGVTVRRLAEAVRAGNLTRVRSMLAIRPELVNLDCAEDDEHQALHHAVLQRQPEMVRLLMQHGADPRKGIYPHRDATAALTLAAERRYTEIVEIIREEEVRRSASAPAAADGRPAGLADAVSTPAGTRPGRSEDGIAREAVATGDANWLRARHAEGALAPETDLLTHAVKSNRPDMLAVLLDLGLNPDAPGRVAGLDDVVPTWGGPLRECAMSGKHAMAEILLSRGANANTNIYAASSALSLAYARHDARMIALLEAHGGRLSAVSVGSLGLTALASTMLEDDAAGVIPEGASAPPSNVAEDLLWGAIECPSPAIVELALARISWGRGDPRWHGILENGLYLHEHTDRPLHLKGFRLTLSRSDPNVRSRRGATLLHHIAASRGGLTARDRITLASLLLERGARLDLRDDLLASTPLGWACRWGRIELVQLFLAHGADPVEPDAASWATPAAWAGTMNRTDVLAELRKHASRQS